MKIISYKYKTLTNSVVVRNTWYNNTDVLSVVGDKGHIVSTHHHEKA